MAHRNTGKVAQRAKAKWLQLGLRLFGCWGPVPWLFVQNKPKPNTKATGRVPSIAARAQGWLQRTASEMQGMTTNG